MREGEQRARPRVLIAGGGVAALEAALALRELAGERLEVELWAPRGEFVYRPFAVGEPFGTARVLRLDLGELAGRIGARFRLGAIAAVDPAARQATTRDGTRIAYDHLLVCSGAWMFSAVPGSVTFWGVADEGGVGGVVRRLRAGVLRDVVFTLPAGHSWELPVYELALLAAETLARSGIEDARLAVVTPGDQPLELFEGAVGERIEALLGERGVEVIAGARPVEFDGSRLWVAPGDPIETGAVVSLPRLEGRRIEGLPHDGDGFLQVDEHCRVRGVDRVFAAGDVAGFPVKQGGIATQEADVAAATITAESGGGAEAPPFEPVLHGPEVDGEIVGRYLAPFLR
jgi:sulfide:quinone oxidoreductase